MGGEVEAVVFEAVVGEEGAAVAVEAVGAEEAACRVVLGDEELEAAFFLFGEGVDFAGGAVEAAVLGDEGEEVLFEGFGDAVGGDLRGAECGSEGGAFFADAGDGLVEREIHFMWVLDGHEDLLTQGRGAAIPEEGFGPR